MDENTLERHIGRYIYHTLKCSTSLHKFTRFTSSVTRPVGSSIVTLIGQLPYKGNNSKANWSLTWNNPQKRTIDNVVVGV